MYLRELTLKAGGAIGSMLGMNRNYELIINYIYDERKNLYSISFDPSCLSNCVYHRHNI